MIGLSGLFGSHYDIPGALRFFQVSLECLNFVNIFLNSVSFRWTFFESFRFIRTARITLRGFSCSFFSSWSFLLIPTGLLINLLLLLFTSLTAQQPINPWRSLTTCGIISRAYTHRYVFLFLFRLCTFLSLCSFYQSCGLVCSQRTLPISRSSKIMIGSLRRSFSETCRTQRDRRREEARKKRERVA